MAMASSTAASSAGSAASAGKASPIGGGELRPVSQWSAHEVSSWLASLPDVDVPDAVLAAVVSEGVDGGVLDMVDLDVIAKLGVSGLGLQLRILKHIQVLVESSGPSSGSVLRGGGGPLSPVSSAVSSSGGSPVVLVRSGGRSGSGSGVGRGIDVDGDVDVDVDVGASASANADPYTLAGRAAAEQMIRVAASMAHISPANHETQSPAAGWKFVKENKGVLIYSRPVPGSKYHAFLGKGVVGVPPESVYNVLANPYSRRLYKKTLKSLDVIATLSEDEYHVCQIVHAYHVTSRCLMKHARDFVGVMYNGVTHSNRTFVSVTTSVSHPLAPPMADVVRGTVRASSWHVEPYGEIDSMVTFLSHVEFGGKLPSAVVNMVSLGQPMCIHQLGLLMLERQRLMDMLRPPLPAADALDATREYLTTYEQSEILGYELVYFVGPYAHKRGPTAKAHKPPKSSGLAAHVAGSVLTAASNVSDAMFEASFDTPDGEYGLVLHDHIAFRYEVLGMLSCGVTSQVVKVFDHKEQRTCGIKIIKNKRVFRHIALAEIGHLRTVERGRSALASGEFDVQGGVGDEERATAVLGLGADSISGLLGHFEFRGHLCMVFELMSSNLLNVVKVNRYSKNLTLTALQDVACQTASALAFLHALSIIHCDVKPENILVRNPADTAIKVIDLGSATSTVAGTRSSHVYIQTRYYRAPEIVLGIPFTPSIDVWSLGCVLAELYTGHPLFGARNEEHLLAVVRDILGDPPTKVLSAATRRELVVMGADGEPRLRASPHPRSEIARPLESVLECHDPEFVAFIRACLAWDPDERLTAMELLDHPWVAARFDRTFCGVAAAGSSAAVLSTPSLPDLDDLTSSVTSSDISMLPLQTTLADAAPSDAHMEHLLFARKDLFTV